MSHPACCHHHAGRGLQGTRQCDHITSVSICAPGARLSPCRGAESLAPRVPPPSQQPPPAQHTLQIQQPSTVMFTITLSHPLPYYQGYPPLQYIPPLLNLLLLPPSQHWSPSPPLIKVYQRESTEADNWNFVKYPLAPWCRCTAAIETVL